MGRREGPPGDRDGHRPPADRRQLLPGRLRGRRPLHAVRDPVRLRGRRRGTSSTPPRPRRCSTEAGFPTASRPSSSYRDVGPRLPPDPPASRRRSRPSSRRTSTSTSTIDVQESAARSSTTRRRQARRASSCSAGAPTIPDMTNFLDYHFGAGRRHAVRRRRSRTSSTPLDQGAQTADEAEREAALRRGEQPRSSSTCRWSRSPTAARRRRSRPTSRAPTLAARQRAVLGHDARRPRHQFVFMQNAEPLGLYCADETDGETLRACEQIMESLYGYEVGGTATEPALATECTPERRPHRRGPARSARASRSTTAPTLDANDVVVSYAAQWDATAPAPQRPHRRRSTTGRPVRRASSTRRPVRRTALTAESGPT